MKIRPVEGKVFVVDGRTDGRVERYDNTNSCFFGSMWMRLKIINSSHTVFMYTVFISEPTAIWVLCNIYWLVVIIGMKSVYCTVRIGSSNKTFHASSLKV